ncbi:MAG: DUF4188 domain-containing protein [Sandaracinus sp.]
MTARRDEGFVVFLIGMRVNAWWKPWLWLPIAGQMGRMIAELSADPELGFLGAEQFFGRTTLMMSYWRSTEHLMSFASAKNRSHFPAWGAFYKAVGTSGDVGIWHETYRVAPGTYENVYVNMPRFGLGAVAPLVDAVGPLARAERRLAATPESTRAEREAAE